MAQAYKCDRCKQFHNDLPYEGVSLLGRMFDLCQSCSESLATEIDQFAMPNEAEIKANMKAKAESCANVIAAIKLVRGMSGMGLKEAKDWVESNCASWVELKRNQAWEPI